MSTSVAEPTTELTDSDFDLDIRIELSDLEDGDGFAQAKTVSFPNGPYTSDCSVCIPATTAIFCS
ncbi:MULTISPECIES: hypothetical protein [unclassified Streptomyces]|uniref:Lantibiotic n=1 Tax=Streptomyces johnsoniae TaxID=3075532 RepID=A0ABU2SEP8_9ACTN|nr:MULTISPECIES: hypothetical protein [unclassified Streptomyces]MDT0447136.1 hypothetical protein [Streptomyces sp. DSM 41886]ONK14289.1 hypothetical protein STBA_50720 [Streptomyces sp. MP131-18]